MTDQASSTGPSSNYIELAADIVSAFVSNNSVTTTDLPALISSVHAALQGAGNPAKQQEEVKPTPAVPIKKSVTPDFLISLEDGKRYKSREHSVRAALRRSVFGAENSAYGQAYAHCHRTA